MVVDRHRQVVLRLRDGRVEDDVLHVDVTKTVERVGDSPKKGGYIALTVAVSIGLREVQNRPLA